MPLPKSVALARLSRQHLYRDEKSVEDFTGLCKRKYKLYINRLFSSTLDVHAFLVSTTRESACQRSLTVKMQAGDWIDCDHGFVQVASYFDIKKVDVLSGDDIAYKMNDAQNNFLCVAKMPNDKFDALLEIKEKKLITSNRVSSETRAVIDSAIEESNIADEVLQKMGLI